MKRTTWAADWAAGAAVLAAVSLATAITTGCSAGSDKSSSTVSQAEESAQAKTPAATATKQAGVAPTASPTGPASLSVSNTGLGKTMVGEKGFTVYRFLADTTTKSTCTGACAAAWPPVLTVGEPKAGSGVASGVKLGTTKRTDGGTQVTVNGHPVYYFAGDKKAGDTAGQGLNQCGAKWWALDASGKTITKMSSASPSGSPSPSGTNTGSGGGGY
jgi:predicted lipoprotein with Yx(FWY)xxD motif